MWQQYGPFTCLESLLQPRDCSNKQNIIRVKPLNGPEDEKTKEAVETLPREGATRCPQLPFIEYFIVSKFGLVIAFSLV